MALASQRKDVSWSDKPPSGEDSANYNGGKYIDDKGYVRVLKTDHPKNIRGYAYEHRLVMEEYVGRYLHHWETVHHINEIKTDNRVEKFYLCMPKEHSAVHMEGRKTDMKQRDKMRANARNVKPHTLKRDHRKKKNFSNISYNE